MRSFAHQEGQATVHRWVRTLFSRGVLKERFRLRVRERPELRFREVSEKLSREISGEEGFRPWQKERSR